MSEDGSQAHRDKIPARHTILLRQIYRHEALYNVQKDSRDACLYAACFKRIRPTGVAISHGADIRFGKEIS